MTVDWFTLGAQAANFLILVLLLKHFLYRPILGAMDARERRIADRTAAAEERERLAEATRADYEARVARLAAEREERQRAIEAEVERERNALLQRAREEVETSRSAWQEALGAERAEYTAALKRHLAEGVCHTTREVLDALAGEPLEQRIIATFIAHLQGLDADERERLRASLPPHGHVDVVVTSAFEIDDPAREALRKAVHATLGRRVGVQFELRKDLVCGVDLSTGAAAIEWSVDDYCTRLAASVGIAAEGGAQAA
ncbi:MAG: F0F1 ATP synthase subunit delta [Gammaproteobacteria bacterium]|nr:F0F1 ATP synthase subunit delta [Gammaproteobacteria bacterium]